MVIALKKGKRGWLRVGLLTCNKEAKELEPKRPLAVLLLSCYVGSSSMNFIITNRQQKTQLTLCLFLLCVLSFFPAQPGCLLRAVKGCEAAGGNRAPSWPEGQGALLTRPRGPRSNPPLTSASRPRWLHCHTRKRVLRSDNAEWSSRSKRAKEGG